MEKMLRNSDSGFDIRRLLASEPSPWFSCESPLFDCPPVLSALCIYPTSAWNAFIINEPAAPAMGPRHPQHTVEAAPLVGGIR